MQSLFHPTFYCYYPKEQRSRHPETSQVITQISNTQQVLQEATQKRALTRRPEGPVTPEQE